MGASNPLWKFAVSDAYEPLESVKGWRKCPRCKEFPRVWAFDNGLFAKCCCGHRWDPGPARAESILSVVKRTGGSAAEYSRDNIRIAWNRFIETGTPQNILPEGRW